MQRSEATFRGIEKACMEVLKTRVTFIKRLKPANPPSERKWAAISATGSGGDVEIYIDSERVGLLRGILHELLHVVLDDHMTWASSQVRELFITQMEYRLMKNDINTWPRLDEWTIEIDKYLRRGLHEEPE